MYTFKCHYFISGTLAPNGEVNLDCGSQQFFTCDVSGVSANPSTAWTINGLRMISVLDANARSAANNNDRITTTDQSGVTQISTITITEFSTADNGGTIQCINQHDLSTQGMATISVGR